MKKIIFSLFGIVFLFPFACQDESSLIESKYFSSLPVVKETKPITRLSQNEATSGGNLVTAKGNNIVAKGVCWSIYENPTYKQSRTIDGKEIGEYTSNLTGLVANTTYHVRAYAQTDDDVAYGPELIFTTLKAVSPVVNTFEVSEITISSVKTGGSISSDGGSEIIEKGVVWGTNENPDISLLTKTSDGTGTGNFTSSITGLIQNTTYYVRAYATNSARTGYGPQLSFKTNAPPATPSNPYPGSDTTILQPTTVSLSWSCSDPDGDALTYDVYFGTGSNPTSIVSPNQSAKNFTPPGLTTSTTYYWKIVAKDSKGASTEGPVWQFKTGSQPNNAPSAPSNPSPADNLTTLQPTTVYLSWSCSDPDGDAITYDVYFGTGSNPTSIVSPNQSAKNFTPPGLTTSTTYYWKIVAKDSKGLTTEGPIWKFRTQGTATNYDFTFDGHLYKTVTIGTQIWTVENLRTTKYNDGTSITKITTDNTAWANNTSGAYCEYNNTESNVATYGYLYNWFAVNTGKLAPAGWRVPTDADWTKLTEFVGSDPGTKLKAKTGWSTNTGTDIHGFSALPGGYRGNNGYFLSVGSYGYWWSSTASESSNAWDRYMNSSNAIVGRFSDYKKYGFSVRLVRDL